MTGYVIILVMLAVGMHGVAGQGVLPPLTDPPPIYQCLPIDEVKVCQNIEYDNGSLPNYRNHDNFDAVNTELNAFIPLIQRQCSNALVHLLCGVYVPFCDPTSSQHANQRVPPCRHLCEYVRAGCEDDLQMFGLPWPTHLECDNFPSYEHSPLCFPGDAVITNFTIPDIEGVVLQNITVEPTPTVSVVPTVTLTAVTLTAVPKPTATTEPTERPTSFVSECPTELQVPEVGAISNNDSYELAGIKGCGVPCDGIYFTSSQRNDVAPAMVLLFFIVCVFFTLFTVATFLIDRRRFHYPERPVIFLSFCYLVIALAYIVGSISKVVGGSFACSDPEEGEESFVFQRLPTDTASYRSASCIILFVMVYYFQMAAGIWWVVLTLTWFLAAALKWGKEAVERLWLLYHIIAWSVPAIQVILLLALQLVDGDQLTGLCYPGNFNNVALGVFVFLPLIIYLLLGLFFLVIGFYALVNIRRQLQKDPEEARKLSRLIARVAVYSTLYTIPNVVLLLLLLYELSEKGDWEEAYVEEENCRRGNSCSSEPTFAAFILKYLMMSAIGICSTSWVLSHKTFTAWQKFFCSCGCQPTAYDIPMAVKPKLQTAI